MTEEKKSRIDKLGEMLQEAGMTPQFGLRQQGHLPVIVKMLGEQFVTWGQIANVIGWDAKTAREYFEREVCGDMSQDAVIEALRKEVIDAKNTAEIAKVAALAWRQEIDQVNKREETAHRRIAILENGLEATRTALTKLLAAAPSGDDLRLLLVGINGPGMTSGSENAQALYKQCDDLAAARKEAAALLEQGLRPMSADRKAMAEALRLLYEEENGTQAAADLLKTALETT
jgi:hypothetical protein